MKNLTWQKWQQPFDLSFFNLLLNYRIAALALLHNYCTRPFSRFGDTQELLILRPGSVLAQLAPQRGFTVRQVSRGIYAPAGKKPSDEVRIAQSLPTASS